HKGGCRTDPDRRDRGPHHRHTGSLTHLLLTTVCVDCRNEPPASSPPGCGRARRGRMARRLVAPCVLLAVLACAAPAARGVQDVPPTPPTGVIARFSVPAAPESASARPLLDALGYVRFDIPAGV